MSNQVTTTPQFLKDRASGSLDAILLSSLTVGTFTFTKDPDLGTQDWNTPVGQFAVVTIEQEQIKCTTSVSGATVTCTIVQRGFNGTTAATHDPSGGTITVKMNVTAYALQNLQSEVEALATAHNADDTTLWNIIATGLDPQDATTIAAANQHTIAGDSTAKFTVGRVFLFKVSGVWYRSVVRSSSYGGGTTTINITGDSLPGAGTVQSAGFELGNTVNKATGLVMVQVLSGDPAENPPSGYVWFYSKSSVLYIKDSSGNIKAAVSPTTTKGDLIVNTGSGDVRFPVGTNNYIIVADSAQTDGIKWADPLDASIIKSFAKSTTPVTKGTNTTAEQNLFSISIPANTLGTSRLLQGRVFISSSQVNNTNDTYTFRLKYGSTTLLSFAMKPKNVAGAGYIDFNLFANGATNVQGSNWQFVFPAAFASFADFALANSAGAGTGAEDDTTTLNLILSVQCSANNDGGVTMDQYDIKIM